MFAALVTDMKGQLCTDHLDHWLLTIRGIFRVEFCKLPVNTAGLPTSKLWFSRLKALEASCLLRLLDQVFAKCAGTLFDWKRLSYTLFNEVISTNWAFTELVRRLPSQHKWAQIPVLNQCL